MPGWVRFSSFVALVWLLGIGSALAQSAGADGAITSQGRATPAAGLTPAQKRPIYNPIVRQRMPAPSTQIEASEGSRVSRSVPLAELPDQTGLADASFL